MEQRLSHLNRLNKYFYKYRRLILLGILFVTISNYFRVLQPQMIREALDLVLVNIQTHQLYEGSPLQDSFTKSVGKTLAFFGILVLAFALLMGLFMYWMRQTIIVMSRLIEYDLRKELYAQYQRLSMAFYKRNNTGDLMSRISEDVSKVRNYLGPAVLYGINLVALFVLVIYSMLRVSPLLTFYSLAPLPFLSLAIYWVSTHINKRSEKIQQQLSKLTSMAQEVYSGIRVVKSYVQEKAIGKQFEQESEAFKETSLGLARIDALFFPVMLLMIGASTIITIYAGGVQVSKGLITPGNIAEFVIYVNMLTWPVTSIGWIASIVQQAAASQKRINEFMDLTPEIADPRNLQPETQSLQGDIQFNQVTFTYPDTGITALKNVSFHLKPGEKMAILGRTGSGKTTIADLLVRMYDASEGSVLLDGKKIQAYPLAVLRKKIGYVPQDVFLFSDTIAANVSFGKADATRQDVEDFTRYAAVHEDITGLSQGFDTMVGERGVTLSGGQKQRVSIARALIKQPDIVLMDDCLSAVDTNTEKQILGYFQDALSDKTAIIITHRIYSLLRFDQILVLDEGQIVERGTHEDLITLGGYYAGLYEKQTAEDIETDQV